MAERIRKGDTVAVITGDDRGKRGRVLRIITDKDKVVVEGVNLVYKHLRKSQQNPQGGRVRREAPIPACRVQPVDPETNRPTRIGIRVEGGKRARIGRRSGVRIDSAPAKKEAKAPKKAAAAPAKAPAPKGEE